MARQFVILKTGSSYPDLVRRAGDFEDWTVAALGLDRDAVTIVDPGRDEPLPPAGAVSGVIVTGSHAMVTDETPWQEASAAWLRELVTARVPVLGICFGHQLLAQALGGSVGYRPGGWEVGTVALQLTSAGVADVLMGDAHARFPVQMCHEQSVLTLPPGAELLASTPDEPNAAYRAGPCAWGVQFHPEFTDYIMREYLQLERESLEAEGIDVERIAACVRASPADGLLRSFAELTASDSISNSPKMKEGNTMYQKNIDALLAAWNKGDLEGLDAAVAPNALRRAPASMNSDASSLDELKQVITDFRTAFPDSKVTVDEMFFQGDRSFSRWTFEGTNTGPGDFPPTGKKVKVTGTSFGRYADGKLTEEIVHFDAMDMMSQLGLVDLPGAEG